MPASLPWFLFGLLALLPTSQEPAEAPAQAAPQGQPAAEDPPPQQGPPRQQGAQATEQDLQREEAAVTSTPLPPPRPPETRALTDLLVLGPLERPRRSPLVVDPFAARLVQGDVTAPGEGQTVELVDGSTRTWTALHADDGRFEDPALRDGWAHVRVADPEGEVLLLEARGHTSLVVDEVSRGGDVYSTGWVRTPFVARPEGTDLYLRTGRGRLQAQVSYPPAPIFLEDRDATLPDLVRGRLDLLHGSVVMVNATDQVQPELFVTCTAEFAGGAQQYLSTVRVRELKPLESRKLTVPLPFYFEFDEQDDTKEFTLIVSLHQIRPSDKMQLAKSQVRFPIRVRRPEQTYQTSFLSSIDGSAQVYAVQPAAVPPPPARPEGPPGLVLSLHGAGVQARGQAESYAPKPWTHVVAPTNRRPFGFDWEDWGRIDALEVLFEAGQRLGSDPSRTYVTGHSMGGHGAWQLGVHATGHFAAVAPSAGWCDFWTYAGAWEPAPDAPVEQMLARAANASRTALLLENLASRGVYVLHGDADDNVPVREARDMRDRLEAFHTDFAYHEQPGAGHWWGSQCVDWPPLFEFLASHRLPRDEQQLEVRFATVNPSVSDRLHWVVIEAQHRSLEVSRVEATLDPQARSFRITSENVSRLTLDLSALSAGPTPTLPAGQPLELEVDGQNLATDWRQGASAIRLLRTAPSGPWVMVSSVSPLWKSPERAGPFKEAFRNQVMLVYATGGTPEENAWSIARARYDLDTWAYRGNGSAELVSDEWFLGAQPHWRGERNIVLYGHADMNLAWSTLDPSCPVEVRRGFARVGGRRLAREDLAVLFTYPRSESPKALAAVVCGTGAVGLRLTQQLSTFTSGIAWPDWTVLSPQMLEQGSRGVLAAGFFGYDWSLQRGQAAWQPEVLPR